jgi:hypothetical protein
MQRITPCRTACSTSWRTPLVAGTLRAISRELHALDDQLTYLNSDISVDSVRKVRTDPVLGIGKSK